MLKIGNGIEMMPERYEQTGPLCKFGPGGDFIVAWEPEPSGRLQLPNRPLRLLSATLEAAAVALGLKHTDLCAPSGSAFCSNELTVFDREKARNAAKNVRTNNTAYPAPVAVAKNDRVFSAEPMLFPDLGRNGVRVKPKPKHRIRAYHRTAKKGSALGFAEQGSLFENQFKSARTA
jgi:hypothetical protein